MELRKRYIDAIIHPSWNKKIQWISGGNKSERAKVAISILITKKWQKLQNLGKLWLIKMILNIGRKNITLIGLYATEDNCIKFKEVLENVQNQTPDTHH